jgi:phosphomethylpyrimidine synthase
MHFPTGVSSRRSLGEGGCSMKITEDARKYAAEHAIDQSAAIEHGMKEKAAEFQHSGAEIYSKP